ncbi:hypothetical protein QQF64_003095 [Cirrhinus molitorella]|uniref:Uncharacterized protein n=1 Tax=Cirrhinus molitorella TaxID=172907 RepID=A0ABR3MKX8_9TELE
MKTQSQRRLLKHFQNLQTSCEQNRRESVLPDQKIFSKEINVNKSAIWRPWSTSGNYQIPQEQTTSKQISHGYGNPDTGSTSQIPSSQVLGTSSQVPSSSSQVPSSQVPSSQVHSSQSPGSSSQSTTGSKKREKNQVAWMISKVKFWPLLKKKKKKETKMLRASLAASDQHSPVYPSKQEVFFK